MHMQSRPAAVAYHFPIQCWCNVHDNVEVAADAALSPMCPLSGSPKEPCIGAKYCSVLVAVTVINTLTTNSFKSKN